MFFLKRSFFFNLLIFFIIFFFLDIVYLFNFESYLIKINKKVDFFFFKNFINQVIIHIDRIYWLQYTLKRN